MLSFNETFRSVNLHPALRWHCEPSTWHIDPATACLNLYSDANTDFWQRTHYGFEADNGHVLCADVSGDFVLTTQVTSYSVNQYDQAGLIVRISPSCWLKTSVEFEPHETHNRLGAVVTNGHYSDWSTQPLSKDVTTVWFRIHAEGNDCRVESSLDGEVWHQIRLAHLHERASVSSIACGLYACSPKAAGYRAAFHFLDLKVS